MISFVFSFIAKSFAGVFAKKAVTKVATSALFSKGKLALYIVILIAILVSAFFAYRWAFNNGQEKLRLKYEKETADAIADMQEHMAFKEKLYKVQAESLQKALKDTDARTLKLLNKVIKNESINNNPDCNIDDDGLRIWNSANSNK